MTDQGHRDQDDHHLTPAMRERLLAGTLPERDARWTISHLVEGCEACWRVLRGALEPAGDAAQVAAAGYEQAITASLVRSAAPAAGLRAERLAGAALWATIEGTPRAQRWKLIAGDPRYHTWAVAARFLEEAAELHWRDPRRALAACRLALAVAERLPAESYPPGVAEDLRGHALGCLADALRLDRQPEAAREALGKAWKALKNGTGDLLERAGLLRVAANLQLAVGDYAAAAAALRPAARIYRRFGERQQEGRTLLHLAHTVGPEHPTQAVGLAERALAVIEPGREPRLDLAVRHVLIWCLNDCGFGWDAIDLLARARPLYLQWSESRPRLMLPWLEARICRQLRQLAAAERGLVGVWHDFREAGFPEELTLVSLDLAETLLAQGKTRHATRLLRSFYGTLGHFRMHADGLAAWRLLIDTAAVEAAEAQALMRTLGAYYRRAWRRRLRFVAEGAEAGAPWI